MIVDHPYLFVRQCPKKVLSIPFISFPEKRKCVTFILSQQFLCALHCV